ncbi:MAG: hypothetical protein JKX68_01055 [Flavobacteriales bacterium]|nr:hypothetical protein [Flavobacteriales bacterium]
MSILKKTLFIISILAVYALSAQNDNTGSDYTTGNIFSDANEFEKKYGEVFLNLIVATAVEDFPGASSNNDGFGVGLGGVFNPFNKINIIKVGIDFGYMHMGKSKTVLDSIPLKTTLSIYPVNLILRLRLPKTYMINPYVDLLGGMQYIETNTKYDNSLGDSFANTVLEENTKTLHATANSSPLSYGFGCGLSLGFDKSKDVLFDIGFRYLKGSKADYVSPEDLKVTKYGEFYYTASELNSTDMMYFHVGIIGYF